jgi:hypothetical protein
MSFVNLVNNVSVNESAVGEVVNGDAHLDGPQSAVQWAAEKLDC